MTLPVTVRTSAPTMIDIGVVNSPVAVVSGQKTVTTSGTRVALGSSTALYSGVMVKADVANGGTIYLGGSSVSSSNGYKLAAGDSVFIVVSDLSTLYVDASANTQSVSFIGS